MRAGHLAIVVGAVLTTTLGGAAIARAGFISVLLSAGENGVSTASASGNFQFTNPADSPQLAINDLAGTGMIQAGTGGGVSFFNLGGVPVVLSVADGSAFIASSGAPAGAIPSTGLGSIAPEAGGTIPTDAALLSLSLSDATGGPVLTLSVTDAGGDVLGSGQVSVPAGGWWAIGLTSDGGARPPVEEPPVIEPPVVIPPVVEPPVLPSDPPTAATPEPTTLALAAIGLPLAGAALGRKRLLRNRN